MTPLNLSRPSHLDREARTIRIEALQKISFSTQIARDWDEICRQEVEGEAPYQRCKTMRFNQGA